MHLDKDPRLYVISRTHNFQNCFREFLYTEYRKKKEHNINLNLSELFIQTNSSVLKSLIRRTGEWGCGACCLTSAECCTLFSLRALLTGSQSSDVNPLPSLRYAVCRAHATYRTEERSNTAVWWAEKSERENGGRGKRVGLGRKWGISMGKNVSLFWCKREATKSHF